MYFVKGNTLSRKYFEEKTYERRCNNLRYFEINGLFEQKGTIVQRKKQIIYEKEKVFFCVQLTPKQKRKSSAHKKIIK